MSISVQCDCGKTYRVGDDKAGKKLRCKECNGVVAIPKPQAEPADEWDDFGDGGFDDFGGGRDDDYGEAEAAPRPKSKSGAKSKGKGGGKSKGKGKKSAGEMAPAVKYGIAGGVVVVAAGIVLGILYMRGVIGGGKKGDKVAQNDGDDPPSNPFTGQPPGGNQKKTNGNKTVGGPVKNLPEPKLGQGAIAAIRNMGGRVKLDHKKPGRPVMGVILHGANVTDAALVNLKGLTKLQSLSLAGTNVTGAGLAHLKSLTSLQSLTLDGTKVTDAGLMQLSGLTELRELSLHETNISDAGLSHLKELAKLERLWLGCPMVTDSGLVQLKAVTSLRILYLRNTRITDAGVKEFNAAMPKCLVDR